MNRMKILLVEDDRLIGQAVVRGLTRHGYTVQWLLDGLEADLKLRSESFDMVILDLGLPGMDGMEVLRRLRLRDHDTPAILLTARDQVADRIDGLDSGADDYVSKPFDLGELHSRIQAVRRRIEAKPERESLGLLLMDMSSQRIFVDGISVELAPREWGVLVALRRRHGQVVSKTQIIESLSRSDTSALDITDTTIEVFIHRLRKKLQGAGVEIHTVRGFGYVLKQAS